MTDNGFFKLTPLYKEFMLLDMIEKNSQITQRDMSAALGVALSMVNSYLDEYENNGFINRNYKTIKNVEYNITSKGIERKKLLNISYLNASQKVFNSAKENIVMFLNQIIDKGFKNILLYGAGEVAEILLNVIYTDHEIPLKVMGIVDDDKNKQGKYLVNTKIVGSEDIKDINHDGILIASYTNSKEIYEKLNKMDYNRSKVIRFFQ
jgi:DNA-binding MarR family transcriptional regulator